MWNATTKQLHLPLYLSSQETGQQCSIEYNAQGEVIAQNCYDTSILTPEFLGVKTLEIMPETGIEEVFSSDQLEYFQEQLLKNDASQPIARPVEDIEPAFERMPQQLNQRFYSQL